MPARSAGRGYRLRLGDPERVSISVVRSPQHSVVVLMLPAAQRRLRLGTRGLDGFAPASIVKSVQPHSAFALAPMLRSNLAMVPNLVAPIEQPTDVPMSEQLDYLREVSPEALIDDIRIRLGEDLSRDWHRVLDHPQRWLDSMAAASLDTWRVLAPVWQRRQGLIDREIERLGVARVRGGTAALLDSLHANITFADGWLTKTDSRRQAEFELDGRHLVLIPAMGDPKTTVVNFERPGTVAVTYPVPGLEAVSPDARPPHDPLAQVLGRLRAATLRAAVTPTSIGVLARTVHMAPNTATYHCDHLERAGLIRRERHQQSVIVAATDRGRHLIELLSR